MHLVMQLWNEISAGALWFSVQVTCSNTADFLFSSPWKCDGWPSVGTANGALESS
jgi:hypothetical protein